MVTRIEFEEAYKKFSPDTCELFFLKYISLHSLYDNKLTAVSIGLIALFPLSLEILFQLLNFSHIWIVIPSYIYIFLLALIGIYWLRIWTKKRKRFEKIRKYLNITKEEYKKIIEIYFYHRYSSISDYINYNSTKK
jgi:hypothetical protein